MTDDDSPDFEFVELHEDEDEELLNRLKDWFKSDSEHSADWRTQAHEDYAFVAGDQWSEEDKQLLTEQLRPMIVFNRVGPVIDAVNGTEVGNRQEVRYIPREAGDTGVNEVLTGAAQWVRDECDAEDEESDAFIDTAICGMGWTETRLDYEEDPEGSVRIDRIDPLEMRWDASARKRNLSDCRRVWRIRDLSKDEAEAMFPDVECEMLHAAWADDGTDNADDPHNAREARYYRNDQSPDSKDGKVRIVQCQWWDRETYYVVKDPLTGQTAEFGEDQYKTLKPRMEMLGLPLDGVKMSRKVFKQAFLGAEIIEQGPCPCPTQFTLRCITGKRDRNNGTWYGLVRAMKDPQRWANKWLSQILHIINSNAKGGLLAEKDAFENPRKAQEEWSDPSSITFLKSGGLQRVQPKPPITYPSGLDKLMEFAISSIRDVSGVNLEMMGMADRQQAGVLEYQRRQAGVMVLGGLFDSLRRYRKEQGRVLLHFIQTHLSDGRLVRIVGKEGEQYVPLVRQPDTVRFDVIVDDSPSAPNQKEQVWQILTQMMPLMMKQPLPPQVWAEVLKSSPLPSSLTQAIAEAITAPPSPEAQAVKQLQFAGQQAEVQKTQAEAQHIAGKNAVEMQKAQIDERKAKMDMVKTGVQMVQGFRQPPARPAQ